MVGAGLDDLVDGDAQAGQRGASCRLVFQSRPAPRVATSAISGSNRWCTKTRAASIPCSRKTAPITASMRVGQDRGLVPTAGGLLAAAQADDGAEVEPAGHVGQRARVDHGRAQLGQLPLGEVRVGVNRCSVTTRPSTESPRNSSRSLVGSPPCS